MKILYATSEAVPFCKTGGLADVAGSLPPALAAEGAQVAVILPLYQSVREQFASELEFLGYDYVDLAWRHSYCGLFQAQRSGVTWYFLDNEQYFKRPDLYGYIDDGERFGFFSRAVVQMLPHLAFWPDVIHCNDWQTALIPIYLKDDGVRKEEYRGIRTMLSVHNIEYQGRYGKETLGDLFGLDHGWADDGTILMDGDVNLLKGAILCADAVNAVSPSYAEELKYAYYAHGLESVMRQCSYKLSGILNGIDTQRYDPETDRRLLTCYSKDNMAGKAKDKAYLQRLMGLQEIPDTPIIGIVSRLVAHKGLDLICEVLHDMMDLPLQLVVLGKGDRRYEEFFRWASQQYQGRIAVRLDYNEDLSTAIYGGADLFLMPSKSEPCGLSQMIAMRYGTVPIVRETGGLKDTVHPYESWRDAGNGFTFASYNSGDMLYVIRAAVGLYRDYRDAFNRLQQRGMQENFSWARSADQYLRVYETITGKSRIEPQPEDTTPSDTAKTLADAAAPASKTEVTARPEEQRPETPRAEAAIMSPEQTGTPSETFPQHEEPPVAEAAEKSTDPVKKPAEGTRDPMAPTQQPKQLKEGPTSGQKQLKAAEIEQQKKLNASAKEGQKKLNAAATERQEKLTAPQQPIRLSPKGTPEDLKKSEEKKTTARKISKKKGTAAKSTRKRATPKKKDAGEEK